MYKLYWRSGTAAFAPQALLEELGEPYEKILIEQQRGADTPEDFRALNPLGQVPVLELPDGTVISESAAITIFLADLKPELELAPAHDDPQRAVYLRWMVFLAAQLYQNFRHIYHTDDYSGDAGHYEEMQTTAKRNLENDWTTVEHALTPGPYFLGDRFSAVDIYFSMFPDWHWDRDGLVARYPHIARLCELVLARPAVMRIHGEHSPDGA